MNKTELVSKGQNLLEIKNLHLLQKEYEQWINDLKQNKDFRKIMERDNILLHISSNPYDVPEVELQKYKDKVEEYITLLQSYNEEKENDELLIQILKHFDLFLYGFFRGKPHRKSSIEMDNLKHFQINNEYDLQYVLYSYLKPIYPLCRMEVPEDTGYETVRTDIYINEETVIETKCSRSSMSKKRLIEEIEADITHYGASKIFFYIYDKEGIIDNPELFKNTYENKIHEKKIYIEILQPKQLI